MGEENIKIQRKAFDDYDLTINDSRYRKAHKIIKSLKLGKFLEIGCNNGSFLEKIKKMEHEVYGLEISDTAAEKGRKKKLNIKTGDIMEKTPFPKNSFDIILAGEIIEHTINDSKFLENIYDILKPNGTAIITTPNLISLKNRLLMLIGKDPRFAIAPYHYKVYTPNLIKELFKKSKFKSFKISGNYIIYSKNRERFLGSLFESLAEKIPSLAEHFIIVTKK